MSKKSPRLFKAVRDFLNKPKLVDTTSITTSFYDRSIDGGRMAIVKVSPKFQVVIPKEVREDSGIKAGSKMDIFAYDGRIELVPIKPIKQLKASLPGLNTQIDRESDRL